MQRCCASAELQRQLVSWPCWVEGAVVLELLLPVLTFGESFPDVQAGEVERRGRALAAAARAAGA